MSNKIDFTNCERVIGKAYNGANGKKIAIMYNGEQYMIKFPPSADKKPTDLSYTNSCISEHISCSIFNMLGIKAQETLLGTYTINEKEKLVCACKDFTADGSVLYDFCSIKNTIIDSEHNGNGTELTELLETVEKQNFVDPMKLQKHFWDVFVIDAFLGNFDRHNGNWGFLYNKEKNSSEIAPVYDCGSCLLPQADERTMQLILNNQDEMNARIFHFPTSAIKCDGQKINYHKFITSGRYDGCNSAIMEIFPRISIDKINEFIASIPYLTNLQREFYSSYITARYEQIMTPAYEMALEHDVNYENTKGFELNM